MLDTEIKQVTMRVKLHMSHDALGKTDQPAKSNETGPHFTKIVTNFA